MAVVSSVEPLSATITSPSRPASAVRALSMAAPMRFASLRVLMITETVNGTSASPLLVIVRARPS